MTPPVFAPERDIRPRTLWTYVRGIAGLAFAPRPRLTGASFARIAASDWSDLPPAQSFTIGSARLGFRHYCAADSRQVIVLVHGSACFGDLGHEMAVRLVRRNAAHVYTLDMRGHGLSDGPRGHAASYPGQLVDDVAAFVRHLHATLDRPQITLAGHSAGGGIVIACARTSLDALVSSYLLLAPFLGLGSPVNRPHFGGWVRLKLPTLCAITLANAFGIRRFNHATAVTFDTVTAQDPRYVASWSYTTLLGFGPGRWTEAAAPMNPDKPVLVLACHDDECFVPGRYARAFARLAPHAAIPTLGPGGHWDLLVDAYAARLTIDWLKGQRQAVSAGRSVERRDERAA